MNIYQKLIENLDENSLEEKMRELAKEVFNELTGWDTDNYIELSEIDRMFNDSNYAYELRDAIKEEYPIQDGEDEDEYNDRITEINDEEEIFYRTEQMVYDMLIEDGWESEEYGYSKIYEYRDGYQELLDWLFDLKLNSDNISYETSKSWASGILPSIYIKFEFINPDYINEYYEEGDYNDYKELRIANHSNGNHYEYNYVYDNDDFKNWETKIKPDIEEWLEDMREETSND